MNSRLSFILHNTIVHIKRNYQKDILKYGIRISLGSLDHSISCVRFFFVDISLTALKGTHIQHQLKLEKKYFFLLSFVCLSKIFPLFLLIKVLK